jgi:PAS domain S-box-containing protein
MSEDHPHPPSPEEPEQPFRTFLERMQEGALTLTADGVILYANPFFAQLVGVPLADLLGQRLARVVSPIYHSTLAALVREGTETVVRGQCRLESPNGALAVQLTLSPLAGGRRPSCCAVVFDLREREQREQAHAARAAAEQANKAKDQFLAVLSHELRSPLNTILGWSQILMTDPHLSETTRRAVHTIERNARTQAELIADLLDISRIVAGKLNLEMGRIDLSVLVESALAAVRPAVEQKGITLRQRLAEEVHIYADGTRTQQVLANLLNNAIKFTERGGAIDVTLDADDAAAVLRVRDTGVGIGADLLARMFEIFHQGATGRRNKGGLGLGLAIARQLVEAHGGTLLAESDGEGKGATFTVRLPRASQSVRPPRVPYRSGGQLEGLSVLLVDDDRDNLDLARYLLEGAGAHVTSAATAGEALAVLEGGKFSLVVSDIGLPDQDGLELMREIRARGFGADALPSIALTGYAGMHDARLVEAAGYQRHLAKPVDAQSLLRAAEELGQKTAG